MNLIRLSALLLAAGVGFASPALAAAPEKAAAKSASTSTARTTRKPTYSAAASSARKARLERARAASRVREQSRLRAVQALQVAMTPRFKTDASGELVPDVRAAGLNEPHHRLIPSRALQRKHIAGR